MPGKIAPVLVSSGLSNKSVTPLLDAIVDLLPSPADRPAVEVTNALTQKTESLKPAENQPLAALVFKTTADPFVGKLTYFRVFSGVIHSDSTIWNGTKGHEERLGQLFTIRGKAQEPATQLGPGEIGAVAKLQDTGTGDTLCLREHPVSLSPFTFPNPVYDAAVSPKSKADLDKLGTALSRIIDEDPTLRVRKDTETGETVVSGMGEAHLEVAAEKAKRKFGVEVLLAIPRIPYRETITVPTKAEYKHKKQSGGHGQYGHVLIEMEPLERGTGFEFAEKVIGGAVPRNFVPAVEKGVREILPEGPLSGNQVVDLRVTLYDGSYHPVDSSEMAFKVASAQAFKKGFETGHPVLLEPVMMLSITVPDQYVGDVMGDLNTKRARVMGINPSVGTSVVEATAPLAEVQRYANDLRSLTQGRGTFTMTFDHYEEMPQHVAQQIIAETKKEKAEAK
jgi:elongation factor G